MVLFLLLVAVVIFTCVLLNAASNRIGMPVLLAFILLGVIFGNNGLRPVRMENFHFVEQLCSTALIFIMFYGGFCTRWSSARPVAPEAGLLATLGVILTACITGVLCHFLLGWGWVESLLLGSVVSSTDAASVFSILRSKKLGLKNGTASLLEVESGSNDPCAYMMTMVMLSMLNSRITAGDVALTLLMQLGLGVVFGLLIAYGAAYLFYHIDLSTSGFASMFLIAVAILSYALTSLCGGNGYLSTYIVGVVLGNRGFNAQKEMVHFFDGFTSLMQVLIFFMLGLLARLDLLAKALLPALVIFLILFFVARPATVAAILAPFRKYGWRQQSLISFAGLRGASSIAFAIVALVTMEGEGAIENDLFNIVFCIVLVSIAIQGTLLPHVAKKLDMIDPENDVMRTFSDFSDEVDIQFAEIAISGDSAWNGKMVRNLNIPREMLLCMVITPEGKKIVPNGNTLFREGDNVIVCSKTYKGDDKLKVQRYVVPDDKFGMKVLTIRDFPVQKSQVMLLVRGERRLIPHGSTEVFAGDILYINKSAHEVSKSAPEPAPQKNQ